MKKRFRKSSEKDTILWRGEPLERFKKVLIASVMLSGLLIGSFVIWFVMSRQPLPYQRVPLFRSDFEDYPSKFVANRSQGKLWDEHIALASVNRTEENYSPEHVFLGLKLTGFHYNPPEKVGNLTSEGIVISRLDILVTKSDERLKIEELSLSCKFDKSLGEDVMGVFYEPFVYNLQLIKATKGWISPSEPFITWRAADNYPKASVINEHPLHFVSYNTSMNHEFILTLTLVYSFDSSTKHQTSTSLFIAIKN